MEEEKKFNWKEFTVIVVLVSLAATVSFGLTWYVMDNQLRDVQSSNDAAVASYQARIASLESKVKTSATAKTTAPTTSAIILTNDQIYQEVASQFSLARSDVQFFRIFGQDKVQFSTSKLAGYAYKSSGTWKMATSDLQGVDACSSMANVPTNYLPPCVDANGTIVNVTPVGSGSSTSTNYPPSQMVSYIGQ